MTDSISPEACLVRGSFQEGVRPKRFEEALWRKSGEVKTGDAAPIRSALQSKGNFDGSIWYYWHVYGDNGFYFCLERAKPDLGAEETVERIWNLAAGKV